MAYWFMARIKLLIHILMIIYIGPVWSWSQLDCDLAKDISYKCLRSEVQLLSNKSRSIQGNYEVVCNKPVSEQICDLCRSFNKSRGCLDILFDYCEYSEIHEFIWRTKLPYLGTIASLCNFENLVKEIHENGKCYAGITVNLRQCYRALEYEPSCLFAQRGYNCSSRMANAYCAELYNSAGNHKLLSQLYLRAIEPMIDIENCTDQSELFIAEIYPDIQYRWKKSTMSSTDEKPVLQPYGSLNSSGEPKLSIVFCNIGGLLVLNWLTGSIWIT